MLIIFEQYDIHRKNGGFAQPESPCRYFRTRIHNGVDSIQIIESDYYFKHNWDAARRSAYDWACELAKVLGCEIEENFFQERTVRKIEPLPQKIRTNPCPKK